MCDARAGIGVARKHSVINSDVRGRKVNAERMMHMMPSTLSSVKSLHLALERVFVCDALSLCMLLDSQPSL